MQINFVYDASTATAPSAFRTALAFAASALDTLITNPITVTIQVGWGEIKGTPLAAGALAEGGDSPGVNVTYSQLIGDLTAHADNIADRQELAYLPGNAQSQLGNSLYVTTAQEKAWGLIGSSAPGTDGYIGFGAGVTYDFNTSNQNIAGQYGFVGVAEHELTHALGRLSGNGAFDLTDYTAPGVLNTSGSGGYYSLDGGVTNLGAFAPSSADPADWASANGDSFNYAASPGVGGTLTEADVTLLSTLGFSEANTQFLVIDQANGSNALQNGTPYAGPVAGLTQEYFYAGTDALAITAHVANSFIHTGGGDDAINVSQAGGNNVLDGSTGSNFMTGGSGNDTFFVDDRNPTMSIWSTITGFHKGDSVTVWGVTQAGFTINWLNGQGAPGATGLTAGITAASRPDVNFTLAGYSSADLAAGGRLALSFGTTPAVGGLAGSAYLSIKGV